MYTVPSYDRLTQALTVFAPPEGAWASDAPALRSSVRVVAHPSSRTVNVRPAAPTMNWRRVMPRCRAFVVMAQPSLTARSIARTMRG